jgi:hypothetical protein
MPLIQSCRSVFLHSLGAACVLAVSPLPLAAQGVATPGVSAGVDVRRDRFTYRFENLSSFDTATLVPHVVEQTHDTDNVWFAGRAAWMAGGRLLETEFGASLASPGVSSDYDTFRQPGGDVVVYGTTADTRLRSWRAAQFVGLGGPRGVRLRVGYGYRRDRSEFLPSDTTTTHSQPPSSAAFWNTSRETTRSELHRVLFGLAFASHGAGPWTVSVSADVAPVAVARLTVLLPDKYPSPVVFSARSATIDARASFTRRIGRLDVGGAVELARAWSYGSASGFRWTGLGASVLAGIH